MHLQPVFDCDLATDSPRYDHSDLRGRHRLEDRFPAGRIQARMLGGEVVADSFQRGMSLPSGTQMTEDDLERVISAILKLRT
jgi:hypothetical protein